MLHRKILPSARSSRSHRGRPADRDRGQSADTEQATQSRQRNRRHAARNQRRQRQLGERRNQEAVDPVRPRAERRDQRRSTFRRQRARIALDAMTFAHRRFRQRQLLGAALSDHA